MTRILMIIILCAGITGCGNTKAKKESDTETQVKTDVVEVIYFHNKQRCASCVAIEKNAKELVETEYEEQVKSGKVIFRTVDITENERLVDRYEISFSSLIVVDWSKDGKEKVENMTEFAFAKARKAPGEFKSALSDQINTMLKN